MSWPGTSQHRPKRSVTHSVKQISNDYFDALVASAAFRTSDGTKSAIFRDGPFVGTHRSDSIEHVVRIVFGLDLSEFVVVSTEERLLKVGLSEVSLDLSENVSINTQAGITEWVR